MEAPNKIFVPTRFRLVDGLRVRESDTDVEYIRKDALLEWAKNKRESIVLTKINLDKISVVDELIFYLKSL